VPGRVQIDRRWGSGGWGRADQARSWQAHSGNGQGVRSVPMGNKFLIDSGASSCGRAGSDALSLGEKPRSGSSGHGPDLDTGPGRSRRNLAARPSDVGPRQDRAARSPRRLCCLQCVSRSLTATNGIASCTRSIKCFHVVVIRYPCRLRKRLARMTRPPTEAA
jgi:hypothetical protein